MTEVIRLAGISKTYQGPGGSPVEVLQDVSLSVSAGQVSALVGPSGSGKSTVLTITGLLQRPDAGAIQLTGRRVDTLNERERTAFRRHNVGFVFQSAHLLPQLTALENVVLPGLVDGRKAYLARGRHLLAEVGLADRARHLPGQLSGGESQRVAMCRSLFNHPLALLADEPTAGLDRESAEVIRRLIRSVADGGVAVLIATHDPATVAWADAAVELDHGRIRPTAGGLPAAGGTVPTEKDVRR